MLGHLDRDANAHARKGVCFSRPLARWPSIVAALIIGLVFAFAPFEADLRITSEIGCPARFGSLQVSFEKCEAYATPLAPVAQAGKELIIKMAAAAGLTPSQFVATVAGAAAVGSGLNVVDDVGVSYSYDVGTNLKHLVNAADYPDWSTLSDSEKEQYGTEEDYDATKFCELMKAFGQTEVVEQYFADYAGGGGETSFNPNETEHGILETIGRIGNRWLVGLGNQINGFEEIIDRVQVANYLGVASQDEIFTFDATGIEEWPSAMPTLIRVIQTNAFEKKAGSTARQYMMADRKVMAFIIYNGNKSFRLILFDKDTFNHSNWVFNGYGNATSMTKAASYKTYGDLSVYEYDESTSLGSASLSSNVPINIVAAMPTNVDMYQAAAIIVGNHNVTPDYQPDVPGYPAEPEGNVYFPDDGVKQDTTWNDYTTPTEIVRPENNFNPGNETGTDKWKADTEANLLPLTNIHFEKLFPFCMIYDIQLFWNKMVEVMGDDGSGGLRSQAVRNYEEITIPFPDFMGGEMTLDLSPLRELLNCTKDAVFWLLLVYMIMSVVDFWKNILTGG